MRYKKLSDLVRQVRAEARLSTSSSKGLESEEYLIQIIRRIYETLWDDYDWEQAKLTRTDGEIAVVAGTYLYDLPANAYYEGISKVWTQDSGGQWLELNYGIDRTHMNQHDSAADERADPVQRWAAHNAGTKTQIEIWPRPVSNGKIAIEGKRKPTTLKDGDSIVDLDDLVLVLLAAAEVMVDSKPKEAQMKSEAASMRLLKMRVRASPKTRWTIGRGQVNEIARKRGELNVQYSGNPG
jgi:hypothetical protein